MQTRREQRRSPFLRRIGLSSLCLGGLLLCLVFLSTSCQEFQHAPGTPDLARVVQACESILKDRYYQTKVHSNSGHVYAITPITYEGVYPTMRRIDIHVVPEVTGHYMPRVYVRKFVDLSEPPLESGDFLAFYDNTESNAFAKSDWTPIHYDRLLEQQIRNAIFERLKIITVGVKSSENTDNGNTNTKV